MLAIPLLASSGKCRLELEASSGWCASKAAQKTKRDYRREGMNSLKKDLWTYGIKEPSGILYVWAGSSSKEPRCLSFKKTTITKIGLSL